MGCIFSCLGLGVKSDTSNKPKESEMVKTAMLTTGRGGKEMSRKMSNPSVQFISSASNGNDTGNVNGIDNGDGNDKKDSEDPPACCCYTVTGSGLALAAIDVEQDAAYWEWHIETPGKESTYGLSSPPAAAATATETEGDEDGEDLFKNREEHESDGMCLKFGVATAKNRQFYRILAANDDGDDVPMEDDGTALMRAIPNLKHGDTVGVAVQQSDLPMVQFLVNGEPVHHLAINRFRGTVYPSVWLPPPPLEDSDDDTGDGNDIENPKGNNGSYQVTIVFDENKFKELAPHARFGPLIASRGLI